MDKILIVEDDISLAQVMQTYLEKKGCIVANTLDGEHALKWLGEIDKPDLIIIDIGLPDMDGLELCKKIKNNLSTRKIPIIILTGREGNDSRIKGTLDCKANLYLNKPIEFEQLYSAIKSLIEKYREEQSILRNIYEKNGNIGPSDRKLRP
ncbi:MAG: response regulator [Elusimicrobia bacterium]|nr:response regulator [Elusimicrobiota bacterium]